MTEIDLGRRIKYFRERVNMSQFDLEVDINASAGAISRIENNRVNPTKETILSIADVLDLNNKEIDYLIGKTARLASEREIERAKEEVKEYFSNGDVFGYLLDERYRFICFSKGFYNLYKNYVPNIDSAIEDVEYQSVTEVLLDDSLHVRKYLKTETYNRLLENQLFKFYNDMNFMFDDDVYNNSLDLIRNDSFANTIWEKLVSGTYKYENLAETRDVNMKFKGVTIKFTYYKENLKTNSRFRIIEYAPKNPLIRKVLQTLIKP